MGAHPRLVRPRPPAIALRSPDGALHVLVSGFVALGHIRLSARVAPGSWEPAAAGPAAALVAAATRDPILFEEEEVRNLVSEAFFCRPFFCRPRARSLTLFGIVGAGHSAGWPFLAVYRSRRERDLVFNESVTAAVLDA